MRLILIRHGESRHSLDGTIAGKKGCMGLTPRGYEQALALADRLHQTGELRECAALLSSPVLRARQTADVLAKVLSVGAVEEDCDLCEVHPGEADGLAWDVYRARYGEWDLVASPDRPFSPEGEAWSAFLPRVEAALCRLADRFEGRTVVAVSHAAFVVASVLTLFAIPRPGTRTRLDPVHTSLTEWERSDAIWRLIRYNDCHHLADRP